MTGPEDAFYGNVQAALAGLVPLAVADLARTTFEERAAYAEGAVELIAGHADQLMFASSRSKPTGVLSAIARSLAVLAYQPGGVTALGVHACTRPHPGCAASSRRPGCCVCGPDGCDITPGGPPCPVGECAWCRAGCSDTGDCCGPAHPMGRFRILDAEQLHALANPRGGTIPAADPEPERPRRPVETVELPPHPGEEP